MAGIERASLAQRARMRLSSWRIVLGVGFVYVLSQAIIGAILHDVGPLRVLRLQTTLSLQRFEAIFAELRAEHLLDAYARHFDLDFVHPVWYAISLAALLAKALDANELPVRWSGVVFLPFAAGAFDLVENVVHVHYLTTGATTAWLVLVGGLAAISKWALVALSWVIAAALGIAARLRVRAPEGVTP